MDIWMQIWMVHPKSDQSIFDDGNIADDNCDYDNGMVHAKSDQGNYHDGKNAISDGCSTVVQKVDGMNGWTGLGWDLR